MWSEYAPRTRIGDRPLVWVAAPLIAGMLCTSWGYVPGVIAAFLISAGGFALGIVALRRPELTRVALALAFFGAGAVLWQSGHSGPPGDAFARHFADHPVAAPVTFEGRVSRPDTYLPGTDYIQFMVEVDRVAIDGTAVELPGGVLVRWSDPEHGVHAGDRVRVAGVPEIQLSVVNPGTEGVEDYYRRHGIHSLVGVRGDAVKLVRHGPVWSVRHAASQLRALIGTRLWEVIPESSRPFVFTVWLGERRLIDQEVYDSFLKSGTAHILAVSGIHTGIIFVTTYFLLRFFVRRRRLRALLTIAVVFVFALMAGARVSSLRAATMIAVYLAAELFDRESDAPTALSLAAIVLVAINPDILFDTGFLLSFLSIASILVFADVIRQRFERIPRPITDLVTPTLAVQVLPLPIAVARFHVLPFAGVALNLLVIPLLTVVLWLAFVTTAAALFVPPLAPLFGHALAPVTDLIQSLSDSVAGWGNSYWLLTSPTPVAVAVYWVGAACLFKLLHGGPRTVGWAGGLTVAILGTVAFWNPWTQPPEVTFLDVGHGDATFIRTPGGTTLLVDGGDRSEFIDMGEFAVAPFLRANHVRRLDAVVGTHNDSDHLGGLSYIVDHFEVGALILGPYPAEDGVERELVARCRARGVPVHRVARGDALTVRGAQVDVMHPPEMWDSASDNDQSLVLHLQWPGMDVLLTGDIEAQAEGALSTTDVESAFLKVPHHGSTTSSTPYFLDAVDPAVAVISTGRRRGGSVLRGEILARYVERDVAVFRTDVHGGLRLWGQGSEVGLQTARGERGYITRDPLLLPLR